MSVLPSLIAALERAAGDCLVLRSGERPHVVAGEARHDVGTTVLSVKAVEALAAQILSPDGQKELSDRSSVQEVLNVEVAEGSLTARAERAEDVIYVELRRHRRAPKLAKVDAPVAAVSADSHQSEAPAPVGAPAPAEPAVVVQPAVVEPMPEPEPAPAPPRQFIVERFEPVAEDVPIAPAAGAVLADAALPGAAEPAPSPAPSAAVDVPVAHDVAVAETVTAAEESILHATPVAAPEAIATPEPALPAPPPVMQVAPVVAVAPAADVIPAPVAASEPEESVPAPVRVNAPSLAAAPVPSPVRRAAVVPAATNRDLTDDLDELIADAAERGATALYLRAGQAPAARIDERLQPLDNAIVPAAMLEDIVASCTAGRDGWTAGAHGEWVRTFELAGEVRCYPFADHAGAGVVIRLAPRRSATGLQRHVPRQIRRACESEDGLVLVAAPTQAELLAMVAAVADLAARKRSGYVICLEPTGGLPHPVAGAFVSERKLTGSADHIAATVRRAVQEAPDILVVGSVESAAAIEEVVFSAVVPGRLVVLGVVAPTALRAVEAILSGADREREPQLRRTLAAGLRAAFGYRGLRRVGGGRTAVQDVIVGTSDVRARLERADFGGIEQLQRQGGDGMRTLDAALARAVSRRQVSLRQAAGHAGSRSELVQLTRRDARERRAVAREHRSEWRQGVLRAI
jgi:twitching motility protein PilT